MAVTASRIGSSPITLDWSNLTQVPGEDRDSSLKEAWIHLRNQLKEGVSGFFDAPTLNPLSQEEESQALAKQILSQNKFKDCLFLGIGGSALGPISLLSSLQDRRRNGIRFHFIENPDPLDWKGLIAKLDRESTLVCVVTKSGTTFETIALFLLALDWMGKDKISTNFIAITDPSKGDLKSYADREKIARLDIAPSIGGRFSIFTPVGLFPAGLSGLSVSDFLKGARQVRDYVEKTAPEKNALFALGYELFRLGVKRPIHLCMPYSSRLKIFGGWFVQIWGESLGKDGKGFTPLAAVGATDQHSILQLLRDGPDDKVTGFITINQQEDEVRIPRTPFTDEAANLRSFKLLEGHTLHELLTIEYRATSLVLTKQGRPHFTFQMDQLDERGMGALYFCYSVLTAFVGALMGVNPFDQPGVEEGKVYIRKSLEPPSVPPADEENTAVARLRRTVLD